MGRGDNGHDSRTGNSSLNDSMEDSVPLHPASSSPRDATARGRHLPCARALASPLCRHGLLSLASTLLAATGFGGALASGLRCDFLSVLVPGGSSDYYDATRGGALDVNGTVPAEAAGTTTRWPRSGRAAPPP